MMPIAEQGYVECARIARRSASSFSWSFWLLPRQTRRAMRVLYAFSRITDDLADSPENASRAAADSARDNAADNVGDLSIALADWRHALQGALDGQSSDPVLAAVADVVRTFRLSPRHLFDIVDGVEQDARFAGFESFGELETYCHRVASSVGLACLGIWGVHDPRAEPPARDCGVAFQLTNILRDLLEDAYRGRVYLPRAELAALGVSVECLLEDLLAGHESPYFKELIDEQVARASAYYRRGFATRSFLPPPARRQFDMMFATYAHLLRQIGRQPAALLHRRIRVAWPRRLAIFANACRGKPPSP